MQLVRQKLRWHGVEVAEAAAFVIDAGLGWQELAPVALGVRRPCPLRRILAARASRGRTRLPRKMCVGARLRWGMPVQYAARRDRHERGLVGS